MHKKVSCSALTPFAEQEFLNSFIERCVFPTVKKSTKQSKGQRVPEHCDSPTEGNFSMPSSVSQQQRCPKDFRPNCHLELDYPWHQSSSAVPMS